MELLLFVGLAGGGRDVEEAVAAAAAEEGEPFCRPKLVVVLVVVVGEEGSWGKWRKGLGPVPRRDWWNCCSSTAECSCAFRRNSATLDDLFHTRRTI